VTAEQKNLQESVGYVIFLNFVELGFGVSLFFGIILCGPPVLN